MTLGRAAILLAALAFREAHEQVAADVREGTFEPPELESPRPAPGPRGVRKALSDPRSRFS